MLDLPPLQDTPLKQDAVVATPVAGFMAHAVAAGIRKDGREDLALIAAQRPVPAAGVFTQNPLTAAPVQVARQHVASGYLQAIIANSGGANASTGQPGVEAAIASCRAVADALGCDPHQVAPCSTGVIGQLLAADKVAQAMPGLAAGLTPDGLPRAAHAIRTTDAFTKMASATAPVGGKVATVVGLAKGAGMIRPDMATMLAYVLTDAAAQPEALRSILAPAAELSFNRATVDGDTSTNDTLLLLASGELGNDPVAPGSGDAAALQSAVTQVCQDLAMMMVADGEGAGHVIRVVITGAASDAAARHQAYGIAHSPLCKTACAGRDPNWGRLLSAAAAEASRRDIPWETEATKLWIGDHLIAEGGVWTGQEAEDAAVSVMKLPRYQIHLDLGLGSGSFWLLTSDLDHDYITCNADYRS